MSKTHDEVTYPKLPSKVMGAGGPVTIKLRNSRMLAEDKEREVWGTWDESRREIELDTRGSMPHQWRVFFHELTHAMLSDSGLENLLTDQVVEAICDANATARMREKFG